MDKNKIRNNCNVCGNKNIIDIINLGNQPFADTFIPKSRLDEHEDIYPLICQLCKKCKNIQLKYKTDPNKRYNDFEYSYTSSNSNFATNHWNEYFNTIEKKKYIQKNYKVLEIGSNDGYLLNHFKKYTNNIVGLDASKKMTLLANKKNIFTINGLMDQNSKNKITTYYNKFDLIIANNVINHMDELKISIKMIKSLLSSKGVFVFEQPYWLDTIKTIKYDQIYHEHITYFTVSLAKSIAKIINIKFFDFEIVNYHGKSIRFYFTLNTNKDLITQKNKIQKQIFLERKKNLFNVSFYNNFQKKIINHRNIILEKILNYKNKGYNIIAVGAAAKSNTWLNFHNLDSNIIKYITDKSLNKKNKFTPKSRIKIVDDIIIKKEKKPVIIILTWNIYEILKKKILKINKNSKFIKA